MKTEVIQIEKAKYLDGHKVQLYFSDGKKRIIDFKEFLLKAKNPMTTQFLNLKKFKKFKVVYGDLLWGDYEMCFPIFDLYEGKI